MFIPWNTLKTSRGSTNHVVRRHIFHSHTRRTRSQSAVEKGRAHGEGKWKGRKEGRNEWRREGREKGGGEEERYKAILSGFSCDCWGENVQMSASTPASSPSYPSKTTALIQEQKAACSQKIRRGEKNLPNTSKTRRGPFVAAVGGNNRDRQSRQSFILVVTEETWGGVRGDDVREFGQKLKLRHKLSNPCLLTC